jgi:hypothetical protein
MKVDNPFLVKGYVNPTYFCDREIETEKLVQAAINGRDTTLFSLRRIGKSGLLHNIGYHLKTKHNYAFIYCDIYNTENLEQLVAELTTSVLVQLMPEKRWLQKIKTYFKHISPIISFDEYNGMPQIQMNFVKPGDAFKSLEELFNIVNTFEKPVYWAWDEFQQLNRYDQNEKVIKELRGLVQKSNNIRFAFSGSHTQMLISMFNAANMPFYKSTQMIELKEIEEDKYTKFIQTRFKKGQRGINKDALKMILDYTLRHTWFTQMLCNRLYQLNRTVGIDEVKWGMKDILDEQELMFLRFRQLLSKKQWDLLKAIAKEERVVQATSGEFISKHALGGSATVLRSLNKLQQDEFVVVQYENDTPYFRLNDVFLMRWMQYKY